MAETGICRLVGHKNVITNVSFMRDHNIIISSSKDSFVKFWDLDNEYNFKTLIGHRSEVITILLNTFNLNVEYSIHSNLYRFGDSHW